MVAEPVSQAHPRIPPLENGDTLTRAEFERRYEGDPRKIELIDGVVYVASPVSLPHSRARGRLSIWLSHYVARQFAEVEILPETTIRLDVDNEPRPDISLRRIADGSSSADEDEMLTGPPELVAEIALSSASYDLGVKRQIYRRNGVQEYLVWRVYDAAIDWFVLREGQYLALEPDDEGVITSEVFPDLRLDVQAMLAGDIERVLARLS